MESRTLPNCLDNAFLVEMCDRLKEGLTVRINFGGRSMSPMIDGKRDKVELVPLKPADECKVGEVYLFKCVDHYVIHRLMAIRGSDYIFRGDACYAKEHVGRNDILAKLSKVIHSDGTEISCEDAEWKKRSKYVSRRRSVINGIRYSLSREMRNRLRVWYFVLLAVLMWAPLNGLAAQFPNYVLGLRFDHLVHASIYVLCAFFLMDLFLQRSADGRWRKTSVMRWSMLLATCIAVGVLTESVQALLPFRGFDVNDLLANFLGATLGWLIVALHDRHTSKGYQRFR